MDFDKVKIITNKFIEIREVLELEEQETHLILNVETDSVLIEIQYDKREIEEQDRLKILKKLNFLKKYIKINHIVINSRSVILQGN